MEAYATGAAAASRGEITSTQSQTSPKLKTQELPGLQLHGKLRHDQLVKTHSFALGFGRQCGV